MDKKERRIMRLLESTLYKADLLRAVENSDLTKLDGKKIFVTGGLGLIGSAIVDVLVTYNKIDKVYVGVRSEKEFQFRFGGCHKVEYVHYDALKKIDLDIKDEFYRLAAECSEKYRLIIKDYFCSYEEISAICKSSNVLLIPYLNNSQSSGVLGYAAQFNVPVFSPSSNMLGKIVRKSKLGYISSDVEILGIKTFLESCLLNKLMTIDGQEYLKLNTVNSFLNTLLN